MTDMTTPKTKASEHPTLASCDGSADDLEREQRRRNRIRDRKFRIHFNRFRLTAKHLCECGLRFTAKGISQHQRACQIYQQRWGHLRPPNIVISRNFSAYFLGLPLISAANAEEQSAFFGCSPGKNRRFSKGRKVIFPAGAVAQIARSCARCAAGEPLFGADGGGVCGLDSALHSVSQ